MPQNTLQRRWLTQDQAADYLGVGPRTIRNYIARGALPAYRVKSGKDSSRLIRIDANDVDALLRPIPTTGGDRDAA